MASRSVCNLAIGIWNGRFGSVSCMSVLSLSPDMRRWVPRHFRFGVMRLVRCLVCGSVVRLVPWLHIFVLCGLMVWFACAKSMIALSMMATTSHGLATM